MNVADEMPPPIRIAIESWLDIPTREKAIRLILPQGEGQEFHFEINYVLFNQLAHLCLDALSFPDSNLTPEPILIGEIRVSQGRNSPPLRGAGSLTKLPMPPAQPPPKP